MFDMFTSELMGSLLFLVGLVLLITAVLAAAVGLGMNLPERALLFLAGTATCVIGYYMASRPTA